MVVVVAVVAVVVVVVVVIDHKPIPPSAFRLPPPGCQVSRCRRAASSALSVCASRESELLRRGDVGSGPGASVQVCRCAGAGLTLSRRGRLGFALARWLGGSHGSYRATVLGLLPCSAPCPCELTTARDSSRRTHLTYWNYINLTNLINDGPPPRCPLSIPSPSSRRVSTESTARPIFNGFSSVADRIVAKHKQRWHY